MTFPPELQAALWWLLACAGVGGSAACSGVELGCYTLNRVRLDLRASRLPPDRNARLLKGEIENPSRLVSTILISNNCFNYIGALATTEILSRSHASDTTIVLVNIFVLTPIILIFGECLPKEIFRIEADRLTYRFARPLAAVRMLLSFVGILPLVMYLERAVERLVGLAGKEEIAGDHLSDARRRIAVLLKESASSGALSESQTTLVDRALAMRETKVRDEMVPWARVRRVRLSWGRDRITKYVAEQASSRVPVTDDAGRVVGVLRQIDLYTQAEVPIQSLLKPPARLSPDMPVLEAVNTLAQSGSRVGIVESGGHPVGLVTTKDLVEPLTGELADW